MQIKQQLLSSDMYHIKCPFALTPKGVCVHNTANDASAKNEIAYMISNSNSTSFHIAVDDMEAIQGLPFNRNAWHSGDGTKGEGNRNYIAIEICYSKSGGDRFIQAEKNGAKVVAQLLKQYGWDISHVKKHQDFSNKYCPHRTLDMGWQRFLNMVQAELDALNGSSNNVSTSSELYRVRKTWEDAQSQKGAFKDLDNAKACADKYGLSVFNSKGVKVYPSTSTVEVFAVGSKVKIIGSKYATGQEVPNWVKSNIYTVQQISEGKALIKEIVSWVYLKDLQLASNTTQTPVNSAPSNKQYVNLKPHVSSWRVYRTNVAPVKGNECGYLAPSKYGGLSYEILGKPQTDVYTIQTSSFGKVNIYVPKDNDSLFTNYPVY